MVQSATLIEWAPWKVFLIPSITPASSSHTFGWVWGRLRTRGHYGSPFYGDNKVAEANETGDTFSCVHLSLNFTKLNLFTKTQLVTGTLV